MMERREERESSQADLLYPEEESVDSLPAVITEGIVELESDELNEHECMASLTNLLQHMSRNGITNSQVRKYEYGMIPCSVEDFTHSVGCGTELVRKRGYSYLK